LSELLPMLLRSNKLSWWHHMEVSSLKLIEDDKKGKLKLSNEPDKEKMQWFLDKAENDKPLRKQTKPEVKKQLNDLVPETLRSRARKIQLVRNCAHSQLH